MKSRINRDEREISISELWWYVISKWKWLVIGMFVGALLLGAFGAYKAYSANETPKEITMQDLTEKEREEVKALIEDYEFYKAEEEKLENNYLMNLDYNTTYRCFITYYVDTDYSYSYEEVKEDYASELVSMYKTYITSADVYQKILGLNIEGLESYDLNYMVLTSNEGKILKLAVYANEGECEEIANVVTNALEAYYEQACEIVGEHSFTLISVDSKEMYGETIKNGQAIRNTYIKGLSDNVLNEESELNEKQLRVYEAQISEGKNAIDKNGNKIGNKSYINKKYIAVGALGGTFLAIVYWIIVYLSGKTIKSIKELNQIYTIDVLGKVLRDNTTNKKVLKKINRIRTVSPEEEQKKYVAKTIASKCKQLDIAEIVICSTLQGFNAEISDLVKMVCELGVKCKYVSNICDDSSVINEVVDIKNVVFVELLNVTTKDELEAEIETCDKLSINILGLIVMI